MTERSASVALLLCSAVAAVAQDPFAVAFKDTAFAHTSAHNYAQVARHPSGDIIMVHDLSVGTTDRAIYALRTSAGGALQWMQRIEVTGAQLWDVSDMALTPDGSIVITGTDGLHGLFLRLDATGVPVAAKWYSWTGNTATTTLHVVNDTTIVIFGNNRQSGVSRGWTAVVDAEGDLVVLANSFQVGGYELAAINELPVAPDKSLLFGRSDVIGSPFQNAVAAMVIDSTGSVAWSTRFTGTGLVLRPVGAIVLADGSARLVVQNDGGFTSQSTIVIAVSPTGAVLWTKELHPKRGTWDMTPLSVTPAGPTTMIINGYYDPVHSGALLIDTAANALAHESWSLTIIANEGFLDTDGSLVLGAHTPVSGSFDPALLRTYPDLHLCASAVTSVTANGFALNTATGATQAAQSMTVSNVLPDFQATAIVPELNPMCITTDVAASEEVGLTVNVFPNPANDRVTITGSGIERVEVLDAMGRRIIDRSFTDGATIWIPVDDLPNGSYLLRAHGTKGMAHSRINIHR